MFVLLAKAFQDAGWRLHPEINLSAAGGLSSADQSEKDIEGA
jgi:hypothetical protein